MGRSYSGGSIWLLPTFATGYSWPTPGFPLTRLNFQLQAENQVMERRELKKTNKPKKTFQIAKKTDFSDALTKQYFKFFSQLSTAI